jgi:hypothetical protein
MNNSLLGPTDPTDIMSRGGLVRRNEDTQFDGSPAARTLNPAHARPPASGAADIMSRGGRVRRDQDAALDSRMVGMNFQVRASLQTLFAVVCYACFVPGQIEGENRGSFTDVPSFAPLEPIETPTSGEFMSFNVGMGGATAHAAEVEQEAQAWGWDLKNVQMPRIGRDVEAAARRKQLIMKAAGLAVLLLCLIFVAVIMFGGGSAPVDSVPMVSTMICGNLTITHATPKSQVIKQPMPTHHAQ